jgi:putative FmdB family regulatory protein
MPIYEYECARCGRVEEVFQKISEKPLSRCRHCSGKLHKLISQSSFHLKGTGWYVTDYANRSSKKSDASKNNESSGSQAKDSSSKSEGSQSKAAKSASAKD